MASVSPLRMRRCAATDSDLAWLADRTPNNELTGYDAGGWPASVWILHAMYERPVTGPVPSADDVWQQRLADGTATVQPSLGCLLDGAVATGVPGDTPSVRVRRGDVCAGRNWPNELVSR